jgi:phage terminase small subunit
MDKIEPKLTIKQRRFAELYVELGNASEAYRQAYDVSEGTKTTTINTKAKELLKHGTVAVLISNLQKELALESKITRHLIVQKYLDLINLHSEYN